MREAAMVLETFEEPEVHVIISRSGTLARLTTQNPEVEHEHSIYGILGHADPYAMPKLPNLEGPPWPLNLISHDDRTACEQGLDELLEYSAEENWDGEGSDPVSLEAVATARKIIRLLPGRLPVPEISADPHGRVDFDWHLENGTMFSISVNNEGEIVISGLLPNQSRVSGTAWDADDEIPELLNFGFRWLETRSR